MPLDGVVWRAGGSLLGSGARPPPMALPPGLDEDVGVGVGRPIPIALLGRGLGLLEANAL